MSGDTAELRVRLFPDDIGIAPPLAAVSDAERGLGEAYWRARAASKQNPGNADLRSAYEGAWSALAAAAGAYRASYVVRAIAPANPDAASSDLQFNDPSPPQTPPVPRAELLPDRFVVLAYTTNAADGNLREVGRAVGAAIPDDLVVGPDPSLQDSWLTRDPATGRIVVPDALKWMVDFDAAVSVGMAVRIPLDPPYDIAGFDRVLAVGVRAATPAAQGPAALEALLAKHRFGDGCAIVRAGTPTNNTDTATSGWQPPAGDAQDLFAIEDAPPDIAPGTGALGIADGWRLGNVAGAEHRFREPAAGRNGNRHQRSARHESSAGARHARRIRQANSCKSW